MVSPREILDMQGDLAERLETPQLPQSGLLQKVSSLHFGDNNSISQNVFVYALTGRAYRIGANMNDEIQRRAWPQREGDEVLLPETDLFGQHPPPRHRGMAVFEEPLWFYLLSAETPSVVHAIVWGFGLNSRHDHDERGWLVTYWCDLSRHVDNVMERIITGQNGSKNTNRYVRKFREYEAKYGRWSPVATHFIPKSRLVGGPLVAADFIDRNDPAIVGHVDVLSPYRIPVALWQLLAEQRETPEQAEKVPGYRGKALGRTQERIRPEVNVVVLRRPSRPTQRPGTGTKRTHRTWVEGGYYQTFWTGPGRQIPVRRKIGGHYSVADESLPIKNRPTVEDLRH